MEVMLTKVAEANIVPDVVKARDEKNVEVCQSLEARLDNKQSKALLKDKVRQPHVFPMKLRTEISRFRGEKQ